MVLINIGCGSTWHPAWTNLDVRPLSHQVRSWDAGKGLPFGDAEVDVCYASHILEHLTRRQARVLLQESLRVLRPGGIIRLAVPDLEAIAREYLSVFTQAEKGGPEAARRYEWITLELLDQLVRTESGGDMEQYLRRDARYNSEYVVSRIGLEAEALMQQPEPETCVYSGDERKGHSRHRLRRVVSSFVMSLVRVFRIKGYALDEAAIGLCGIILGNRGKQAMREGLFRLSGECHRWMYDRISLQLLLERSGFSQVRVCTAFESQIEGFASYGLDVAKGRIRKPDSLFMEAVKQNSSV